MGKIPNQPFLNASFSSRGGGIDFLGVRAVNLRMLQEFLIPGINNATADFGTYCIAAWIPWKFRQLASDKEDFTFSRYQAFREAIEIAVAYSQRDNSVAEKRFGSPRTRIGVTQKVDLAKALTFKNVQRTNATSLFAAPLYGPSLRYLTLISGDAIAVDGTSTRIPVTSTDETTSLLVEEVESTLRACDEYSHFSHLDISATTSQTLDALGLHGLHPSYYRTVRPEIKRAFLEKFLIPQRRGDQADYRRLTARLICESIRQDRFTNTSELRACWYSGLLPNGAALALGDAEIVQRRELWALFMARQIQRTAFELFLRCFELALKAGSKSITEVVEHWRMRCSEEFRSQFSWSLSELIRHEAAEVSTASSFEDVYAQWHSHVHGAHPHYDDIPDGEVDDEFQRAFQIVARWWIRMQKWIDDSKGLEFLTMGDRNRMSIHWFSSWLSDRLSQPLSDIAEHIFSEIVFSQHIKVALSRFDGQVQRLRFTLGDSGIIPTSAAKKLGQPPVRMADRLRSFIGILSDLDVIKSNTDGPMEIGANVDFVSAK